MKSKTFKQAVLAVLIFILLISGYMFAVWKTDNSFRAPKYDRYDQSKRVDKIRKGLMGK